MGAGVGPYGSTRLRLYDYLQTWFRTSQLSENERRSRTPYINRLVNDLGHLSLTRLHPLTIEEFLTRRMEAGNSSTTAHHLFKILRAALNEAVRKGLIAANPCEHVTPPRPRDYVPSLWTLGEVEAFLTEARATSPHFALYATLLGTGLRPAEALALRWRDVDLEASLLRVTRVLERPKNTKDFTLRENPKTRGSRRTVRLPDVLISILRSLHEVQRVSKIAQGVEHDFDLVFPQRDGRPLHENNVAQRDFRKVIERAGLPRVRGLYALRHMHFTYLTSSGVPLKVVQERAGHHSAAFTMSRYIHVLPDMQAQAAEAAGHLLAIPGGLDGRIDGVPDE
jgi:integrase